MNILIIEDEPQAVQRLETLLSSLVPDAHIVGKIDSVKRAVTWLQENPAPDVIMMDIHLADGISFEIFDQCQVRSPVIFTTAYDEYAVRAFKVNSVDYILKPVDKEELNTALKKVINLSRSRSDMEQLVNNLSQAIHKLTKNYKTRFVIKVGEHLKTLEVDTIRFFYSQDKATFCVNDESRSFILDYSLEQIEEMINPEKFYRINRKYLVSSNAIQDIIHYSNSRLRLVLKGSQDTDIIVARERVQNFKDWLNR